MAEFINTVDVIGDDALTDSIIDRSVAEYKDDAVKSIGDYAFYVCRQLTSVDLPAVTSIGNYAFRECEALESVNFPLVTSIGEYGLYGCRFASVDLPAVTSIGTSAFARNSVLTSIKLPLVTSIGNYVFEYCRALVKVDLPKVTSITGYGSFYSCSKLTALILRNADSVCSLSQTHAFQYSSIASGTGYIYVPSALIDSYKAATNWSTFAAQFRALEDYTVDGTTTGELDPTKI